MDPRPVEGLDAAFLHLESPTNHMHVVGILWLDDRDAATACTVETVRDLLADRVSRIDPLCVRVVERWFGLPVPHWIPADVDLEHHVQSVLAPPGSGVAFVTDLAGRIAGLPLDRARPLWEFTVVEGVSGPGGATTALIAKVHHAVVDGVAAVGVLGSLVDLEAHRPPARVDDTVPAPAAPLDDAGRLARTIADRPAEIARATSRLARSLWRLGGALRDPDLRPAPARAPRTGFSGSITARRAVAVADVPVAWVDRVRAAHDVTFTDVTIAIVAGAVRRWLQNVDDLPDRPLVMAVPMSVRDGGGGSGNAISSLFGTLPTHLADPAQRIRHVTRSLGDAKATHRIVGDGALGDLATVAPWTVVGAVFRILCDLGVADRVPPAANLSVTSIAGPPLELSMAGARLVGFHPFGPILESVALNVTAVSYAGRVGFGITGCPDRGPAVADLADLIREEARLLEGRARSGPAASAATDAEPSEEDPMTTSDALSDLPAHNRELLAAVHVRRERLEVANAALRDALDAPEAEEWTSSVRSAAVDLRKVFADHVHGTETGDGFFDAVVSDAPHLAAKARSLRAEHGPLAQALDDFVGSVGAAPRPEVEASGRAVLVAVDHHRHRGAELVLDAYNVDVAAGD